MTSNYPNEIDQFTTKLNISETPYALTQELTWDQSASRIPFEHSDPAEIVIKDDVGNIKAYGELPTGSYIIETDETRPWIKYFVPKEIPTSGTITWYATYSSFGDENDAEDLNSIASSIATVEDTLGANPEGTFSNVKERLSYVQTKVDNLDGGTIVASYVTPEEEFVLTEGQTVINLLRGSYDLGREAVELFIFGQRMSKQAFVETSTSSVTLKVPAVGGERLIVKYIQSLNMEPYAGHGSLHLEGSSDPIPNATIIVGGLMSKDDKIKLNGVEVGANNYTHPVSHSADIITESSTRVWVSPSDKNAWNAKQDSLGYVPLDKATIKTTIADCTGVSDAPPSANLMAITYDGLAGIFDGRYMVLNADKLDNCHVNDTQITTTNLWTAAKINTIIGTKQDSLGFVPEDSSKRGLANGYAGLDSTGKISLSNLPDLSGSITTVVADMTARDNINTMRAGDRAIVLDAGDGSREGYIWTGAQWLKDSDTDWQNVNLDWINIVGKPTSSALDIDNAVTLRHTHSNKSILDSIIQSSIDAWNSKADLRSASDSSIGSIKYNGVTPTAGNFYGGIVDPISTDRLNYDGILWAKELYSNGHATVTEIDIQDLYNKTLMNPKMPSYGYIADANGNEVIKFPAVVNSPVNYLILSNSATGSPPSILAVGSDPDVDLLLLGQGTGKICGNGGIFSVEGHGHAISDVTNLQESLHSHSNIATLNKVTQTGAEISFDLSAFLTAEDVGTIGGGTLIYYSQTQPEMVAGNHWIRKL